jgi:hypothetical protein
MRCLLKKVAPHDEKISGVQALSSGRAKIYAANRISVKRNGRQTQEDASALGDAKASPEAEGFVKSKAVLPPCQSQA